MYGEEWLFHGSECVWGLIKIICDYRVVMVIKQCEILNDTGKLFFKIVEL